MPTWAQKRASIAQALQGGNPPSVGASPMVNPMMTAMGPQASGLMGSAPTQGQMMAQANASLQGAPGFNYVAPQVGPAPAPVPAAAPAAAAGGGAAINPALAYGFGGGGISTQQAMDYLRGNRGSQAFQDNNRIRGASK